MQPFFVISAIVTTYLCLVEGQSSCSAANGSPGRCVIYEQCAPLLALLKNPQRTPQDVDLLRKSHCGFEGRFPKVCCPTPCYTPDGKEGQCISIYSCPHIAKLLQPPVPQNVLTFVQNSRCQGSDHYSVCCGPETTTVPPPVPVGNCVASAQPPDPASKCCGKEPSNDRIYGGNATGIEDYPWLVLIEYVQDNKIKLLCGGSLISGRYVLTAGHCVAGAVLDVGTPTNVRLGEHDISNDGEDCIPSVGGSVDCNEGTTIVPIERTIPHPDYDPYHSQRRNDIALIRLSRLISYTDFIQPVCLPITDITVNARNNLPLTAAGWGAVNATTSKSNLKQFVELPYKRLNECQSSYSQPRRNIALWNRQLCAGGKEGMDSCKGDSGGPLMFNNNKTHELVGIVSFGPTPCGLEGIPGVYTKVFEYMPWIRSQIRP